MQRGTQSPSASPLGLSPAVQMPVVFTLLWLQAGQEQVAPHLSLCTFRILEAGPELSQSYFEGLRRLRSNSWHIPSRVPHVLANREDKSLKGNCGSKSLLWGRGGVRTHPRRCPLSVRSCLCLHCPGHAREPPSS